MDLPISDSVFQNTEFPEETFFLRTKNAIKKQIATKIMKLPWMLGQVSKIMNKITKSHVYMEQYDTDYETIVNPYQPLIEEDDEEKDKRHAVSIAPRPKNADAPNIEKGSNASKTNVVDKEKQRTNLLCSPRGQAEPQTSVQNSLEQTKSSAPPRVDMVRAANDESQEQDSEQSKVNAGHRSPGLWDQANVMDESMSFRSGTSVSMHTSTLVSCNTSCHAEEMNKQSSSWEGPWLHDKQSKQMLTKATMAISITDLFDKAKADLSKMAAIISMEISFADFYNISIGAYTTSILKTETLESNPDKRSDCVDTRKPMCSEKWYDSMSSIMNTLMRDEKQVSNEGDGKFSFDPGGIISIKRKNTYAIVFSGG